MGDGLKEASAGLPPLKVEVEFEEGLGWMAPYGLGKPSETKDE